MRKLLFVAIIVFVIFTLTIPALAAKLRLRGHARGTSGTSYSSVRLSHGTNSIVVTFTNLNVVKSNTYTLSYTANGIEQGVVGTIIPVGQTTDSRDLYIGTCSKGVCTPHYNIRTMILLVETNLTSGAVYTKRYRIKF